jgi:hypothetical protein
MSTIVSKKEYNSSNGTTECRYVGQGMGEVRIANVFDRQVFFTSIFDPKI